MHKGFDPTINSDIIVISELYNMNNKYDNKYYDFWKMEKIKEENSYKSEEEIKAKLIEEIKGKKNKLKEESMQRDYKIDNEKTKELESKFNQIKLKIIFDSKPSILRDGKFYTIFKGILSIYDNKFFNKLHEIDVGNYYDYTSVIQSDNQDLIVFSKEVLTIYRLENKKYVQVQRIKHNRAGFPQQTRRIGCTERYPKSYEAEFIKEISGNRFIVVSNYGFKMYSLNTKNEYIVTLVEEYCEGIENIIELDKNNFIFLSRKQSSSGFVQLPFIRISIDKISLKEISEEKKEEKLETIKKYDYVNNNLFFSNFYSKPDKSFSDEEIKNIIESLEYTHKKQELFFYGTYGYYFYFHGNAILKNKYFIVAFDNNILIFDISSGKQLKRYEILLYGKNNLYTNSTDIIKWNNNKDNEFILNYNGNIILLELINEYELKIINQKFFKNINNLKILNKESNQFYEEERTYNKSNDENKTYSVSIF